MNVMTKLTKQNAQSGGMSLATSEQKTPHNAQLAASLHYVALTKQSE